MSKKPTTDRRAKATPRPIAATKKPAGEALPLTPTGTLDLAAVDEQARREACARYWPGANDGPLDLPDTTEGRAAAEAIARTRNEAVNAARAAWLNRPGVKAVKFPPRPKSQEERLANNAWQRLAGRDAPGKWEQQRMLLTLPQDIRQKLEKLREAPGGLWDFHAELANYWKGGDKAQVTNADAATAGKPPAAPTVTAPPNDLMSCVAIVRKYQVSRATVRRRIATGDFTDYRRPGHAPNAPLRISEAQVGAIYDPKP